MSDPPARSPLDAAITITVFPDVFAKTKDPQHVALSAFSAELRDARGPDKYQLKLFSPGSYGSKRTAAKALRHDNNIVELFAVVGDYDGGKVSVDEAVAALEAAGVCALVLTTPSHTRAFPKWRVVAPLSDPLHRARANATGFELADYHKLVSRLAGVFPDGLAAESWNRSQGWFMGTVDGALDHQVCQVPGVCIDLLPALDANARPRPSPPVKLRAKRGISRRRAEPIPLPGVDQAAEGLASQTEIPDDVLALDIQDALAAISEGEGSHDALVRLAGKFAGQGLPETTVIELLTYAADQRPAEQRDAGWQKMRADIPRVVAWAFDKEAETVAAAAAASLPSTPGPLPRTGGNGAAPPPPPPGNGAGTTSGPGPRPGPHGATPDLDLDASIPPAYSDEALGLTFAEQHVDWLRHVSLLGFWRLWDGAVWRRDATKRVVSRIRLLVRQMASTCPKRSLKAKIASAHTVFAVERIACADQRLAIADTQWDRLRMHLNTPDHVVLLRHQAQQPHQATDYLTRITPVAPDYTADCPLWRAFLLRIMDGDQTMVDYLQRVCGYLLTGHTLEHALFFGHGNGANGKSTFANVLLGVLGSGPAGYAAVAPISTFTASRHEQHTTDLAMLAGTRCVIAHETEENRSWPIAKVKTMSSGDPITARFMRQNFFTYTPQFKILILGNHKPRLHGVDEAIRRRLHLIPFAVTIPVAERDPELSGKLVAEYPAILTWMIQGCAAWLNQRLDPPVAVVNATAEFLADEDLVGTWISEFCQIDWTRDAPSAELYGSFMAWMEQAGEYVPSQRWLIAALVARGYRQSRSAYSRRIIGLTLKSLARGA
jgi:putative DNA primase/helicase